MAGSKKDSFENSLLLLLFNNTSIANIGNAGGILQSTVAGSFYVALFTVNPSDSAQGTECAYTGYARVAVARSSAGWTISGTNPTIAGNAALITFGLCTAGGETITGFAICLAGTIGVNDQIYWGSLTASLAVSAGITPEFAIGALTIAED